MKYSNDYSQAIDKVLQILDWHGTPREFSEAMPDSIDSMDLEQFQACMRRFGYKIIKRNCKPENLNKSDFPALHLKKDQYILLSDQNDLDFIANEKLTFISFKRVEQTHSVFTSVIRNEIHRFSPLLKEILLISLIIGTISLAPILYNRIVYDHIIASGSSMGIWVIFAGVVAALTAEIWLRHKRNLKMAFFGGRIDHYVSCTVFERLLFLPPIYTERASTSSQIARLKDFESVREFFTSPLAALFFELPLTLIYLAIFIVIAGWLALVPIVLIACYIGLLVVIAPRLKSRSRLSAINVTKRQEFILETITKLRELRLAGLDEIWNSRYRSLSNQASFASFQSAFLAQTLETASYGLMIMGACATLAFGVVMAINQDISTGTLIATMMLMWRIIAPLQICCASFTKLQQLFSSTKQVEKLLSVPPEYNPTRQSIRMPALVKGGVSFHRVSLKYNPEAEPALLGVSLDVKPGQIVAIKGNNGSGKSTALKLILGLYQPQAGSVRIDNIDIRQFDPLLLRQSISYIPQHADFFPDTIKANLLFSNPAASDADMEEALSDAYALGELDLLPERLNTCINPENNNITDSLRQKLNLARAYLRKSQICLFDEASYSLGKENDLAFERKINQLRGKSTVIMATHREDHMRLADQLLFMNKGELTHAGPPIQVLNVLKGKKA